MHDELTKKDIEKMEAEIEHRKLVVRKEALEDVKEARAQGDLSENFEYKAAKKFKNENESRIRYLEKMIKTAVIVSEDSPEDEVGMNNTVDIYFEEDDVTETYKLVTTVRSNSLKNLISRESPLDLVFLQIEQGVKYTQDLEGQWGWRKSKFVRNFDGTRPADSGGPPLGKDIASAFYARWRQSAEPKVLERSIYSCISSVARLGLRQ